MTHDCYVLLLTGTCGSGKSTVSTLIAQRDGWARVSEDDIWPRRFGRDRGAFGTEEHRTKRVAVHQEVLGLVRAELASGNSVVIDATIHESPPEALEEYRQLFEADHIRWRLFVLHPRLEVAIARDARRANGSLGKASVTSLYAKFTGRVFPSGCFIDTSDELADITAQRVLRQGAG